MADWFSTFGDGTYQTSSGNINFGASLIYYDRKFLKRATETTVLTPLGQRRPLPKGNGKQIRFFRWDEIPLSSTLSVLTEGINPNATPVTGQEVNATLAEYGGYSQHSSLISDTHIDKGLSKLVGLWGDHAGRTIDMLTWEEVHKYGSYPMRVDEMTTNDGTSYSLIDVAVEDTASQTSVTVYTLGTSLTSSAAISNDWFNNGIMCIVEGTNEGQSRPIVDCASANTSHYTFTVSPGFETACDSSSKFRAIKTTGLTAGDIPTYATLREVRARLKNNLAMPYDGGYFVAVLDPDVTADLMSDSTWQGVQSYKERTEGIFKGELGKIHGFRCIEATQNYKHTAGTWQTRVAAGRVYSNLFLGQEAFGVTSFPGMKKPKIIIKNPGPQDTSNPLDRYGTIGWYMPFVPKALNSKWCVNVASYH